MLVTTTILKDLAHLFYPHLCAGCGSDLIDNGNLLCLHCMSQLPHTGFSNYSNNPIEKIFTGRVNVLSATSGFYFSKGNVMQTLIHELKYKGNKELGFYLGKLMGTSLLASDRFNSIDALIPLPLFPDKEFKRGYNQSTILCLGISELMKIPVLETAVVRKKFTETQTKKHRIERWENVEESFTVSDPSKLEGKHILLIDDVVTTGATLEACGSSILKVPGTLLSIATLANATN